MRKKRHKNIIAVVLVIAFVCNITGVGVAQECHTELLQAESVENDLTKDEVEEVVEKIESTKFENDYMEEVCSAKDMEAYLDAAEGIECTEITEENISVENAVEEVFNDKALIKADIIDNEVTEYNDTKYITEIYEDRDITYVKTYSEDMWQMSILSYDGETISSEMYTYNVDKGEFEKQQMEIVCTKVDSDENNDVFAQAVSYNSKTKSAKWKDITYWYRTGNSGSKTYLKIGCKAIYRIRTDNLTETKDKKCDAYMSAVKSSRTCEKKALAYAAAAGISGTTIIALVLANAAFPPSTIITIVFGILGGGATIYQAISYSVDSFEKWQDARDYYNTIKTYGKKI